MHRCSPYLPVPHIRCAGARAQTGLADDLVVAPYASAMAMMVAPEKACANLRRLAKHGLLGAHGFYEAIDFTPLRVPPGQRGAIVRSFMAHHQGMSLLSMAYLLLDRPMQRRFQSDPLFRLRSCCCRSAFRRRPVLPARQRGDGIPVDSRRSRGNLARRHQSSDRRAGGSLLSNGRYHVMVSAAGGGYSRWRIWPSRVGRKTPP